MGKNGYKNGRVLCEYSFVGLRRVTPPLFLYREIRKIFLYEKNNDRTAAERDSTAGSGPPQAENPARRILFYFS